MKDIVKLFKALSCEWRIEIIRKLSEDDNCLCELEKEMPVDKTTLSRHVKVLVNAGLITQRRNGQRKDLFISDLKVLDLINMAERIVNELE